MSTAVDMEEIITELENITLQCVSRLNIISYEDLQQFLLNREQLIFRVTRMVVKEDHRELYKDRIASILKYDESILIKMNSFKASAAEEIAKMSSARKQKHAYESHYQESYFFDKKK
ncbi:hypothetical protein [Paenibacillus alkalitolerans]|uniref:hypothetical protein n=1 Tax=Paenibacillus alkalitolerans TaxID=2799335 RepID=UPI0018F43DCD|nr:hypothetical protein [Paenibacillus alkalitolerans]